MKQMHHVEIDDADREKMYSLCEIMNKVHALADYAWPRNASGVSAICD